MELKTKMDRKAYRRYFKRYALPGFMYFFLTHFAWGIIYPDYVNAFMKQPTLLPAYIGSLFLFYGSYIFIVYNKDLKEPSNECWYKEEEREVES